MNAFVNNTLNLKLSEFKVLIIKQTVQQDKKDVTLLINIYANILNINKTSTAFTFITFTTQKLNKNIKGLFHSFLVISLLGSFSSVTPSYNETD